MRACRDAGYTISLLFVTTSNVEINVARVAGRVRQGGHSVPEDKIRERYERSLALLPRAVEEANQAFVFDSSQNATQRLCYRKGVFSLELDPPPYLQNRLIDILRRRSEERDEIAQAFGPIHLPNEQDGRYAGSIREAREFYIVQQTEEGNFVRHDRLLLTDCGLNATYIHYRSGAGAESSATP